MPITCTFSYLNYIKIIKIFFILNLPSSYKDASISDLILRLCLPKSRFFYFDLDIETYICRYKLEEII